MKNLKVEDILKVTKGELIIGDKNLECKSFSKDTRKIQKGDCHGTAAGKILRAGGKAQPQPD